MKIHFNIDRIEIHTNILPFYVSIPCILYNLVDITKLELHIYPAITNSRHVTTKQCSDLFSFNGYYLQFEVFPPDLLSFICS